MWNFKKKTAPVDLDTHNKNALTQLLSPGERQVGTMIDFRNGRLVELTRIKNGQVEGLEWSAHPGLSRAVALLAQLEKDTSDPAQIFYDALAEMAAAAPTMTLFEFKTAILDAVIRRGGKRPG